MLSGASRGAPPASSDGVRHPPASLQPRKGRASVGKWVSGAPGCRAPLGAALEQGH